MTQIRAKGWFVAQFGQPLEKREFVIDTERIGADEVVVELEASGLCHTDLHLRDNDWSMPAMLGKRPGHEGIGRVLHLGASISHLHVGDVVGIGWVGHSCHHCARCVEGCGNLCDESVPTPFVSGCFATHTVVDAAWVFPLPAAWVAAGSDEYIKRAPLMCAGATVFAPLERWIHRPAQRVGIVGCGGLGHVALMFAAAMGAEVVLISRSRAKEADALKMGAHWCLPMDEPAAVTAAEGTFDLILSTSPAALDWPQYITLCAEGGAFVVVGLPVDTIPVSLTDIVFRQVCVAGSIVAGEKASAEMLHVAAVHDISPAVEVVSMSDANAARDRLERGDVRYRFVLRVDDAMRA